MRVQLPEKSLHPMWQLSLLHNCIKVQTGFQFCNCQIIVWSVKWNLTWRQFVVFPLRVKCDIDNPNILLLKVLVVTVVIPSRHGSFRIWIVQVETVRCSENMLFIQYSAAAVGLYHIVLFYIHTDHERV